VLEEAGVAERDVIVVWVPGAMELPMGARRLAEAKRVDGLIALGCVIRGETAHFEHVSNEAIGGLSRVGAELQVPIGVGVLTVENLEQARVRAGLIPDPDGGKEGGERHRGAEAARACIEMMDLISRLEDER
jgi:6,7-dimethyl-8-ribityllumazine synthase